MSRQFDLNQFKKKSSDNNQYKRQLDRLKLEGKELASIEKAVDSALRNIKKSDTAFVIYGEPQSGKTEMMICLTARLLDEGFEIIVHLLNDSVDLLGQNLGRFKSSGLAPAAKNFTEILDPSIAIKGYRHIIFCKKNRSDLTKLLDKLGKIRRIVIIDDEADYASPNAKVNSGERTKINALIHDLIGQDGLYIGVTATPARLDLNNTFDNDSNIWVNFPPHTKYTGQDEFFPIDGKIKYHRTLISDSGADPKYAREALFSFLVNVAYLNVVRDKSEKCYSMLVHTSGKKVDHRTDWGVMQSTLASLVDRKSKEFDNYAKKIWEVANKRYSDANPDRLTHYILDNISRSAIVVLNSERDWKDNASSATDPKSLFTIIIGGNIVSRGVTLNNLLSMFFTRDVKHKIQQDTYIQRARMFGNRGDYISFFELTIPQTLYVDWHRCFVFHRLALEAIKEGLGSLVWIGDNRVSPVSATSVDRSTVDLDSGEMSFGLFEYSKNIDRILRATETVSTKIEKLSQILDDGAFPGYLKRFIERSSRGMKNSIFVHEPLDISGYKSDDTDTANVRRARKFIGTSQLQKAPNGTIHHIFVAHDGGRKARVIYKFVGNIQFIKNTANDS